jgi:hypothetical protein
MKKIFKQDELHPCDYQYLISHTSVDGFKENETVFLKSNPELPLKVQGISKLFNHILVLTPDNKIISFPPECLLQYSYAGLLIWKRKIAVCLN